MKLVLEHDADPADGWGTGYKIDLLFGPGAVAYGTQSTGVGSDFAIKQAYLDLKAPADNGLEFKLGVWDTILGYEVFETPLNPNFTRSYGYTIEPATFTGILAIYNFTELISAGAGVANTESSTINSRAFYTRAESYKTYMGYILVGCSGQLVLGLGNYSVWRNCQRLRPHRRRNRLHSR